MATLYKEADGSVDTGGDEEEEDRTGVNLVRHSDKLFALTEAPVMQEVDPESLKRKSKVGYYSWPISFIIIVVVVVIIIITTIVVIIITLTIIIIVNIRKVTKMMIIIFTIFNIVIIFIINNITILNCEEICRPGTSRTPFLFVCKYHHYQLTAATTLSISSPLSP